VAATLTTGTVAAVVADVLVHAGDAGILVVVAVAALLGVLLIRRRVVHVFLVALFCLLASYMFLGRGIAHFAVGPVYIGDLVLFLAIPALLTNVLRARFGWIHALIVCFMVWGAVRTLPYLDRYGINALRDAVIWAYAFFALAVSVTVRPEHIRRVVNGYRRLIPPLLIWLPISFVLTQHFGQALPRMPGSDVPIIDATPGDIGVTLGAVAAFVFVGLYSWEGLASGFEELLIWLFWTVSVTIDSALSRGGMLATSMAATTLLYVRSAVRWLSVGAVLLGLLAAGLLFNPVVQLGSYRQESVQQLAENVSTIFSNDTSAAGVGTKDWRLAWWQKIVSYTLEGPYFWTGKGYGINLADDDGFQVAGGAGIAPLRAPHSIHFDILARSGVPGLTLWILLQAAFGAAMVRAALRAARARRKLLLAVIAWIFVYWLANLVAGSFDVYIEGPQGGILFWSAIGFGMALCGFAASPEDAVDGLPAGLATQVVAQRLPTSPLNKCLGVVPREVVDS
jgi:O-antigen ligase